jgi:hypothetical protein
MSGGSVCRTMVCGMAIGASEEAPRDGCGPLEGGGAPVLRRLGQPVGGLRAHGCRGVDTPWPPPLVRTPSWLSACLDKGPG